MTPGELLADALDRVAQHVETVLDDLDAGELAHRPGEGANSIAWLVWHLTRIYDDHVASAAGREQVHVTSGYAERLGLPFATGDTGYGHGDEEVAAVRVPGDLLGAYFRDVHDTLRPWVLGLQAPDLDRVVDERWDPPVTLGVRMVSVVDDLAQHAGQAAYVRGLLGR